MAVPECITFDLDDTLWDHRRAQHQALEELGARLVDGQRVARFVERFHHHNGALWAEYRAGRVEAATLQRERFVRTLADVGAPAHRADEVVSWFLGRYSRMPYLREGAADVLEELAARVALGCVTDGFTRYQRNKLAASGIERHFRFVITSDDVGATKPSTLLFAAAARAARCATGRIVHVGDSHDKDVVGAARQGFRTVWIPHPEHTHPDVLDPAPDWRIERLADLPGALGLGVNAR